MYSEEAGSDTDLAFRVLALFFADCLLSGQIPSQAFRFSKMEATSRGSRGETLSSISPWDATLALPPHKLLETLVNHLELCCPIQ